MNNRRKYYDYRRNKRKKFKYYCHNNKPYFVHKKYKKNIESNILLSNESTIEPVNNIINEVENVEQLEFVPIKKRDEIVMPKSPIIKMALGIVVLVAIIFGASYAYFNFYYEDTRQADITTAEVYVRIPENSTNITLTKMYPQTNTEARSRNDNYIDFTVNAKNTSPTKILYYTLDISDGTAVANKARISRDYIKVDLQVKDNGVYTYVVEGETLSNFDFEGVVPKNTTSEMTKEYRLRIWVSDALLISDTEVGASYTQSEFANLYANYHIEVNSGDKTPPAPIATTVIKSVEGLETTPYGKVYSGSDAAVNNNYVWFNNEQWRIIGVYNDAVTGQENLKIIKALSSAVQAYDDDPESNAWSGSTMQATYLYGNYTTLISDPTSRAMIEENATWNVGACGYAIATEAAYDCANDTPWTGKIGLIASYEYLYAAENDGTCWSTTGNTYNGECYQKDWLYNTITYNGEDLMGWTLSPLSGYSRYALRVYEGAVRWGPVISTYGVSPVVYLKSTVTITGGNGGIGETDSYKLG